MRTKISVTSAQALAVPGLVTHELRASLPRPTAAALPDVAWGPATGAAALLVVGLLGSLVNLAFLVPSVGASAFFLAVDPLHPTNRPYNILVGHLVGLAAGIAGVLVALAWGAPVSLDGSAPSTARVAASVLALGLAVLGSVPLRATHASSGATALLVTLGLVSTPKQALALVLGVAALAAVSAGLRLMRSGRLSRHHAEEPARRLEPALHPS